MELRFSSLARTRKFPGHRNPRHRPRQERVRVPRRQRQPQASDSSTRLPPVARNESHSPDRSTTTVPRGHSCGRPRPNRAEHRLDPRLPQLGAGRLSPARAPAPAAQRTVQGAAQQLPARPNPRATGPAREPCGPTRAPATHSVRDGRVQPGTSRGGRLGTPRHHGMLPKRAGNCSDRSPPRIQRRRLPKNQASASRSPPGKSGPQGLPDS